MYNSNISNKVQALRPATYFFPILQHFNTTVGLLSMLGFLPIPQNPSLLWPTIFNPGKALL